MYSQFVWLNEISHIDGDSVIRCHCLLTALLIVNIYVPTIGPATVFRLFVYGFCHSNYNFISFHSKFQIESKGPDEIRVYLNKLLICEH